MAKASQLDSLDFDRLDFPYDRVPKETDDSPRIVNGKNIYVTPGNKISKRPGTIHVPGLDATTIPARFISYETLDNPPKLYYLASFEDTAGVWTLKYADLDTPTTWTSVGTLRQVNASTRPHEMVVHRGKVYIKGFPTSASGEKLGTVVWQVLAGSITLRPWGAFGPTEPAHVPDPGTWSDTVNAHDYLIHFGWKYVYSWVSVTGNVTNHSPLETNPDKDPSDTGTVTATAGAGFCPEVEVTGLADTTNFPFINIYRSTDGGGTFFFLDQIANTGAGTITYVDNTRESGAGGGDFEDPVDDTMLDISRVAPQDKANDPPPPVRPPKVANTDQPEGSTKIISWQGRLWYAIGHFLFYSAVEEIGLEGVGEECFSGTASREGLPLPSVRGNYFLYQHPITNLSYEEDALYVHTYQGTHRITGTLKETFNTTVYLADVGAPPGHSRASTLVADHACWLTHDFRVAVAGPTGYRIVSDPLYTDLTDAATDGAEFDFVHWAELDKDYLVVLAHREDDPTLSRQWVLDVKRTFGMIEGEKPRNFWFTPWTLRTVVAAQGRTSANVINRRLLFGVLVGNNKFAIVKLDATGATTTDYIPSGVSAGDDEGYTWRFILHQHTIPPGNHVNTVSAPHREPVVHRVIVERSSCFTDLNPGFYYYLDDFYNNPIPLTQWEDPPRRKASTGYSTLLANVNTACRRFSWMMTKKDDKETFELHNYAVVYAPGSGT